MSVSCRKDKGRPKAALDNDLGSLSSLSKATLINQGFNGHISALANYIVVLRCLEFNCDLYVL